MLVLTVFCNIEHCNLIAGVVLNFVLLYAIHRFTRASLGSYKHLLSIFAAFDIFLIVIHAVVKPRVVIVGSNFGIVGVFEDKRVICIYCACFTVPFALMNIHFLYRYWTIRNPHLIHLFSTKRFAAFLSLFPLAISISWFLLGLYGTNGDESSVGKNILIREAGRRYGKNFASGWIIMNYWDGETLNLRLLVIMLAVDSIMAVSFSIASTLAGLTFYYIKRAKTVSMQSRKQQFQLFIAVCAQTFVPLVFVYIPYFCVINFACFRLPVFSIDDAFMMLTSCFPAWDAVIIILLMKDYRQGLFRIFVRYNTIQSTTFWTTTTTMLTTIPQIVSRSNNL